MDNIILKDQRFNFELKIKTNVIEILKEYGYKFFLRAEPVECEFPLSYCIYDDNIIIKNANINSAKSNFEIIFNSIKLLKSIKIDNFKVNINFGKNVSISETTEFTDLINEMNLKDIVTLSNTQNAETLVEFIYDTNLISGKIFEEESYLVIDIKSICEKLYKEKEENNKNKTLVHYNTSSVFTAQNAINALRKNGLYIDVSLYNDFRECLDFAKKSGYGGVINFIDDNKITITDIEANREILTTIDELLEN